MSELRVNAVTDETGGNTATINSMTPTADSLQGFRNRIINGGMVIDQRNAGAASTSITGYALDRWNVQFGSTGVSASFQQVADAPTGFVNSFKVTVTTAPGSVANSASISQPIEGFNTSDLAWGTASAQTVTLSFWVKSSLTGSFGGALTNSAFDQTYPFPYTISAANTWEYKTVVIEGPTSGTWLTTNGTGVSVIFGLGAEAARKAAADVWANTVARQPTGSINLVETNGATWQFTGVQLEAGSVATPFERRPYGTELALCQRYFVREVAESQYNAMLLGTSNTREYYMVVNMPVPMRVSPTVTTTELDLHKPNIRFDAISSKGVGVGGLRSFQVNYFAATSDPGSYVAQPRNFTYSASAEL